MATVRDPGVGPLPPDCYTGSRPRENVGVSGQPGAYSPHRPTDLSHPSHGQVAPSNTAGSASTAQPTTDGDRNRVSRLRGVLERIGVTATPKPKSPCAGVTLYAVLRE